jgi:hypothetical protein
VLLFSHVHSQIRVRPLAAITIHVADSHNVRSRTDEQEDSEAVERGGKGWGAEKLCLRMKRFRQNERAGDMVVRIQMIWRNSMPLELTERPGVSSMRESGMTATKGCSSRSDAREENGNGRVNG